MRRRKTRTRPLELGAAALAALCLSACGGEAKRAVPPPTLPRELASTLAVRSDAVAAALAGGDECRAFALARQLQRETIAAINDGRVAAPFQEDLTSAVNELAARVTCAPPPAPTTREDERGKHEDRGHGKKKHGKDD